MRFKYTIISLALFIYSCSSSEIINPKSETISANQISMSETENKSGANLPVNISFSQFETKASADGVPARTINDIKSVKLYLTTSNGTNPLLATNVKYASGILTYPNGSASKTYTFFNVPAGTYYVAVELFSDLVASNINNIIEPITYSSSTSGDTAFGLLNGKRGLTISSNSSTITTPTMIPTFSDSSSEFKISPKLLNAIGAFIDTTITAQPGSGTSTEPIVLQ